MKGFWKRWKICISMSRNLLLIPALIVIFSCSSQRKLSKRDVLDEIHAGNWINQCDSLRLFESLYVSKIDAEIFLGQNKYNAKVALYYMPDSLFFISAVNAGFEIVRIGVTRDSAVFINRIDKSVYIYREWQYQYPPPLAFKDLEFLINKSIVCDFEGISLKNDEVLVVDRSLKDVSRVINYSVKDLSLIRFEFFQKKTGEYIVGERKYDKRINLFSNYIVDDLQVDAKGGNIELNRKLNIDLNVNRNKYSITYF